MDEFIVVAERAPNWDDAEVKRRLGQAYRIILEYNAKRKTADRDEFGDRTRSAADDAPTSQPVTQETL